MKEDHPLPVKCATLGLRRTQGVFAGLGKGVFKLFGPAWIGDLIPLRRDRFRADLSLDQHALGFGDTGDGKGASRPTFPALAAP